MATKYAGSRSAAGEREHHRTSLWAQVARFVGLFLSPGIGLIGAWLIHVWAAGIHIHWGPINWDLDTPRGTPVVVSIALALFTLWLARKAGQFAEHRTEALQSALKISVTVVGLMFAVGAGVGPSYVWSGLFFMTAWAVAVIWSIARLDVTRNDIRAEQGEQEDSLLKRWGVSALTKFKAKVVHDEQTGEPLRLEVKSKHAPGETAKPLQDNIDGIESAFSAPPGLSTVIGDPEHADESTTTVMLTDPFKRNIPVGPLTSPGGSIADYASVSDYADGRPAFVTVAAGKHMPASTSYGLIGTTRAGKTGTETQLLTEWGSRIDWVCLYLNQAKGLQDIRPLLPVIEAAVIAEDGEAGLGDYVLAFKHVKGIMSYRQQHLGMYAVSAWSPRCCDPNPDKRPSRLGADAKRHVMEPMPFFTCHVGEADAILNSGRASEDSVFIASKGLSLGVNSGWSLQRPDWKAMPTALRSNIGLWFAHGMNPDDEDFVIPEEIRKAGAHPGRWGQRKPGQHYMFGPGIDESRFAVALKTRFLVGSDKDQNGQPLSFDELNDRYMAEMLRRNMASSAGMVKLDRGSAEATEGWWDEQVAKTVDLRTRMLNPQAATRPADRPATQPATAPRKPSVFAGRPTPQTDPANDDAVDPAEMEEYMNDFEDEAANTEEVEGIRIYGGDPQEEAETRAVDLTVPFTPPATDYDPLADSEEEDKPAAKTREEAQAVLRSALVQMVNHPKFADKKVPGTALVTPADVFEFCGIRSRPWVSEELTRMMLGGGEVKDGVLMQRDGDPRKGQYRIRQTDHEK